ncbi:Phytosulfokine [Artemisia annua]|uniref:Phytosulfokine n=1 Tax=Artemisia annua TaxID=35608 RepID=A0A2U1NMW7_ARTAN|nr:Phytosulfokine [Artemisia annua]
MAKLRNMPNNWAQVVSNMVNIPAKNTIWIVIQRLVFGASVYYIWQERNMRLFGSYGRTVEELLKVIVDTVRCRIMGLKLSATNYVMNAAEIWGFPIDKKHSFLMVSCYSWNVSISTGMWECNMIFLNGVWLMDVTSRGPCSCVKGWTTRILIWWMSGWWCSDLEFIFWANPNCFNGFSSYAGCLLLVVHCGPTGFGCGLWIVFCSCVSNVYERSYSFSLFMVLPKWFYMIRFFKEKTFIIVAPVSAYSVNVYTAIVDEAYGLHISWIWLWCEDVLMNQNASLLMLLVILDLECMVSPNPLVVAVCFLLVFSYGDVWVYIGWSLCITPCIQSMSLAIGKAVGAAFYYGLGCFSILPLDYCSVLLNLE